MEKNHNHQKKDMRHGAHHNKAKQADDHTKKSGNNEPTPKPTTPHTK